MNRAATVTGFALASVLFAFSATGSGANTVTWQEDLDYLVGAIEQVHPNPFTKIGRAEFESKVDVLRNSISGMSDEEVSLEFMRLVALLEDGHSFVEPIAGNQFDREFPFRLYRFLDGVFITAIGKEHSRYAGSQVLKIGGMDVEEVWRRSAALLGADNRLGALSNAPLLLSNATVLRLLGVTDQEDTLELVVRPKDASGNETLQFDAIESEFDFSYRYWGEIWGPAYEKANYVTAFDGRSSDDFYGDNSDLPLHLRNRKAYWAHFDAPGNFADIQINNMTETNQDGQSFADFVSSVFEGIDQTAADKVIVDLRYNIGGDGSLVNTFVHELIRHDAVNQKGNLYVVAGRATFSAGVMLVHALQEHTQATFVGEPPGAHFQQYGDATSFTLPSGRLKVHLSTIYHQLSSYTLDQDAMQIEFPAQFSSRHYFDGQDPALDLILTDRRLTVLEVFENEGATAGLDAYRRERDRLGNVDWWTPFTLQDIGELGDRFRQNERWDDALAVYELGLERNSTDWRYWSRLAELHDELGHNLEAIKYFEGALASDPFNNMADMQRSRISALQ
jgi:hypothetical protein